MPARTARRETGGERTGLARARTARGFALAIGLVIACFVGLTAAFAGSHGAPIGAYTMRDTDSFVTAPSLHPPRLRLDRQAPASQLAPGYILTTSFFDVNEPPIAGQSGPLILDRNLQPVWFQPVPEKVVAANLSLQTYEGRPALAWWQGRITNTGATETGEDVVVNQHYQRVATLKGKDGWVITLHELLIDGSHAWVTANKNIPMNLSKYGGAYNGALIDSAVQEYDLKTGALLRSWNALDHIPLSDSQATLPTNGFPWDAYHVNSIDLVGSHKLLVSMRNTWAAYLIDIDTGAIEWTLGGKHSSFKLGPRAGFQWQHDVKMQSDSTVSMFDDHCCQLTGGGTYVDPTAPSRGIVLNLDRQTHTATLAAQYGAGERISADYMGDTQPLSNGNVFVGWGAEPYFSEFSRSGKLLFEGEFPRPDLSYRTTIAPWVGLPLSAPAGAARRRNGRTIVYASWNGATQVASWRVLAGPSASRVEHGRDRPQEGVRDRDPRAGEPRQLRAAGAGRERARDRTLPAVLARCADGPRPWSQRPAAPRSKMVERAAETGRAAARERRAGFVPLARTARPAPVSRPRLLAAALALAACVALSACGAVSSANSDPANPPVASLDGVISAADIQAAAANPVAVSPQPGTLDASPTTQISFLGGPGTKVADVRVVGSRSGPHGGRLEAYSTGTGESFLPSHPFLAGEHVTVHALVGTGTPSQPASTSFTIAYQAPVDEREFPDDHGNPQDVQHYISAPGLTPSTVHITTPPQSGATPGDLFLAPYQGESSPGPMIAEQDGALVWFHPLPRGWEATNLQVQQYQGKPVLTWWQGRILAVGFGQGEDVIYNTSYQPVATIRAGNGYHADLHVIKLTPEGTAWIDAFDPIYLNLSAAHGVRDGVLSDSIIEEIDVRTGLVMWEWHALGHIALGESKNPDPDSPYPWDYIHINSADPGSDGDVLLSARNSWTLYDVNIRSGAFRWRLGDQHSSFALGPGTRFYWQHDAEFQPGGLISVFDNGSDPPEEKQSRGLLLRPDLADHTVTLAAQYTNPSKTLLASSQGNMLSLPEGNWMLGYGGLPNFTEFNSAGEVLLDGTLGKYVQNFRTYLAPWTARPLTPPSVAVASTAGGALTVAASWNGATEVASWRVLGGSSAASLAPVASAARTGFQTSIAVTPAPAYVAVQALDAAGEAIGTSPAIKA